MKNKILLVFIMILTLAGVTSCTVNDGNENKKEDPCLVETNKAIDDFINNVSHNYVKKESDTYTVNFEVLSGLYLLEQSGYNVKLTDYISKEDIVKYADALDYSYPKNIFIASVIDKAYGITTEKAKTALSNLESVDAWTLTYAYSALKHYNVNDNLKNDLASKITVINPEDYRDADYAGMALCVLSDESVDKSALYELISSSITKDGISSWGTANACSTAYSILGLLASGVDIDKEYLDEEGHTLVENLLAFEENGKFSWELGGVIDEDFSTSQGFLALVAYKLYKENNNKVEIF